MEPYYRGSATTTATTRTASPMRPGTPETGRNVNPFDDGISPNPRPNPFSSPFSSRPVSSASSAIRGGVSQRYFHSRRVPKGTITQPWKTKKDPKEKWVTIIPLIGLFLGLAIAGFLVYDGIKSVVHHSYCPVLSDDFSQGLNPNIWTQEVEVGGYGLVRLFCLTSIIADKSPGMDNSSRLRIPRRTCTLRAVN